MILKINNNKIEEVSSKPVSIFQALAHPNPQQEAEDRRAELLEYRKKQAIENKRINNPFCKMGLYKKSAR